MPTTTKMGIVYPASTDLVKDGATAMGTISTTVDAKSGLVLLNTTSIGAGVSTVSVNSVFSASFNHYKILLQCTKSASNDIQIRLRASGTDESGSNYYRQRLQANSTSLAGTRDTRTSGVVGEGGTELTFSSIEIFNPFASANTNVLAFNGFGGTGMQVQWNNTFLNTTASYDGFTFLAATGTFSTGTIQVFGFNNA